MKKINLVHVITGLGAGGAEKVVLDLSTNQSKGEYNVQVFSISDHIDMLPRFISEKVQVTIAGIRKSISGFAKVVRQLYTICKRDNVQIIHAHMVHGLIVSMMVKIGIPQLKIVFTSHNINVGSRSREKLIQLTQSFRKADILFSKHQADVGIYRKDAFIIPNGVTIPQGYEKKETTVSDKMIFLCVGRLEEQKNHIALPSIVNQIRELDFEIRIAGKGPLVENVQAEIDKYGLNDKITLLGFQSDILKLIAEADVFLMPSLWEGLPIAMLEAGGIGTPIISRNVGSISSLLDHNTGYLVNTDEELTEAIVHVLSNYEEALGKSHILKKQIEQNFGLDKIVKLHKKVYEYALK